MVVQGVKNPMVDLQSLEDKILDEVMLVTLYRYMKTVSISMFANSVIFVLRVTAP